jgi:hypothetical protein
MFTGTPDATSKWAGRDSSPQNFVIHKLFESCEPFPRTEYTKLHTHIINNWDTTFFTLVGIIGAQVVSRWPLTAEARVNPCGICGRQSGIGTGFSAEFFGFPLSISFHRGSTHPYIIWGMNNTPIGGRSSETQSRPIGTNNVQNKLNLQMITLDCYTHL